MVLDVVVSENMCVLVNKLIMSINLGVGAKSDSNPGEYWLPLI